MHVLHQGRAEYTLITPVPGSAPHIAHVIMGTNVTAGETRQLVVGTGVWKVSRIPDADVQDARTAEQRARTGCLITEVVTPGFHWEDHQYLTREALADLLRFDERREERVKELLPFVKPPHL
ncbi:hypothetical protein EW146_g1552 [Bondarzewia mesenterica]|uniref:DUF985 domain-containing protein n=1 Tax=Bondarzewia mesenterica TaxID=1095465 RepID=A0A4S4M3G4_9AGAM|nr:hypothetical protein EW146_g1552 [Bondarzewia mesenterica]